MSDMHALRATDPEIFNLIALETKRQAEYIRLIPSENYAVERGHGGDGLDLEQQVFRGYPVALLRGPGLRRQGRDDRH